MLTFAEYDRLDALDMARLVQQRQVSAAELCDTAAARAQVLNVALNAIVTPLYDQARQQAQACLSGPLAGVPFLFKDFGARLAGVRQTGGSRALQDFVPTQDDELARRWKAAGLLILGTTNCPEFALLGITEPELHGPARNPWHLGHTPGGSSGGAAAAVAAGLVPVAGAGDGGGSIRIPASCCGLFGLKPSRGRVPSGPSSGEPWFGATSEHILSRSVRDSAALLDVEQGADQGAPFTIAPPQRPYLQEAQRDPARLRIGFSSAHPLGGTVHPDVIHATQDAASLLETLGHDVQEVPLPWDGPDLARDFLMLYFGQTGADIAALQATPRDVEPVTWLLGLLGRTYSAADFAAARLRWNDHARRLGRFHASFDLLLTPTLAVPPMRIGELAPKPAEQLLLTAAQHWNIGALLKKSGLVEQLALSSLEKTPFTQIANLTGVPAMCVPLHWANGLPVGVQFIAPFGREDTLFQLAGQLERARPWFNRRPALTSA